VLAAVDHQPHRALDHLEVLGAARMEVVLRDEAARAADGVELELLVVGAADLEAQAQTRGVDDVHAPHAQAAHARITRRAGSAPLAAGPRPRSR
jgi:hypothetical protein